MLDKALKGNKLWLICVKRTEKQNVFIFSSMRYNSNSL